MLQHFRVEKIKNYHFWDLFPTLKIALLYISKYISRHEDVILAQSNTPLHRKKNDFKQILSRPWILDFFRIEVGVATFNKPFISYFFVLFDLQLTSDGTMLTLNDLEMTFWPKWPFEVN